MQVALIYRSPSVPVQQFVQLLTRLLVCVNSTNTTTIVLGDINDNILENCSQVTRLMFSYGYTQLVKYPTTERATLIDHVYFSKQCNDILVQVRDVYYSDHNAAQYQYVICEYNRILQM